jgi:hypothetical protein
LVNTQNALLTEPMPSQALLSVALISLQLPR